MKLVLAEKPSVAQSIAKVLGAAKREDGYLEGNGYVVSWCVGHLVELAQPEVYDAKYSKWAYEHCAEVEATAKSHMELIVPQLMKHYGVTEQLKAENQMEWVRQINACVAQAEETIKAELIYC